MQLRSRHLTGTPGSRDGGEDLRQSGRTVEVKMKELGNSWREVKATVFSGAALKTPYVGWSDKK